MEGLDKILQSYFISQSANLIKAGLCTDKPTFGLPFFKRIYENFKSNNYYEI